MTDWLPWGFALMLGNFVTLYLILKALGKNRKSAWVAYWLTVVISTFIYLLYIIYGESWVWYLR